MPLPSSSTQATLAQSPKALTQPAQSQPKIVEFVQKEVDMMPGQWQEAGNPTPYELRTTIATCKRFWHMNQQALKHPDCDQAVTRENIKRLECLYINLMDYLVE
ncbi:hypothetical protein [Thiosulfativibrio zosterae]|uniref:Uncharacterized protein n=1 Tax=Thiosulfativibrio zosterae TaxID=2675053 RepID=A0A6F8PPU2_9GAMM|nr:hypothetical protein [Thiosulfativibrio zosterae]BBP44133.1 hypothetical protein THMIRHAT_18790 [Thiosulfativibrio zosterae]